MELQIWDQLVLQTMPHLTIFFDLILYFTFYIYFFPFVFLLLALLADLHVPIFAMFAVYLLHNKFIIFLIWYFIQSVQTMRDYCALVSVTEYNCLLIQVWAQGYSNYPLCLSK